MAVSDTKKRIMLSLDLRIAEVLEVMAKEQGLSKSSLVTNWVNEKKEQ